VSAVLGERETDALRQLFGGLERDIHLQLELGPELEHVTVIAGPREIDFGAEARKLAEAVAATSDRVRLDVVERQQPGRYPAFTVTPGELRYVGLPWGYELTTLVQAILEAGRSQSSLSETSRQALAGLERPLEIEVYVTPT
jgi:alkyl hydroperoxide reductase subunit AhpF